jgi:hypothetical protein
MIEPWFQIVEADQQLSQGDVIIGCPVLTWMPHNSATLTTTPPPLEGRATVLSEDVIVMTQPCDLEQHKVHDVVLCRHIPLAAFQKKERERWMSERGPDDFREGVAAILRGHRRRLRLEFEFPRPVRAFRIGYRSADREFSQGVYCAQGFPGVPDARA